ncbi:unnamed protein product [Musa acuminata subsp. burmannicoides]
MNLSPSNLGANLSSASLLDPDPAASCFLDDPNPYGAIHHQPINHLFHFPVDDHAIRARDSYLFRGGGGGDRGGGVGGGESSGRDGREGGGEDPSLLHLHAEIRNRDLPLRRRRTFCGVVLPLPLPPALYGLLPE